jgi:vancomycin resistance protein YoaR
MPDRYYQEYGPIKRRRASGEIGEHEPSPEREPPRPQRPSRIPRRRERRRRSIVGPFLFLICAVGVALLLPYAANLFASERALSGISVQGQPVGGLDRAGLLNNLQDQYAAFEQAPILLTFEGQTWSPTLSQLGVRLDLEQTVADAVTAGRRGGPIQRAEELWTLWNSGLDVGPRLTIDTNVMQAYLSGLALNVEQPPRNAALSIAEGKVLPTAGQPGRQTLIDATIADIVQALQTLEPQTVALQTRDLKPTLDNEGIAQAVDDARALLKEPMTLKQGERSWTWEPADIAAFLAISAEDGQMQIGVDQEKLARTVEKLAQVVDSPSAEPRVAFRRNALVITEPGQIGLRLKQPEAVELISATLRSAHRTLTLPIEELSPQVTEQTLPELGIVELVSEGQTSFAGSADYRITNIKAGAARMDGVLIPPGAELSFNTQLGAVDESNGFVQGYAVIGNRTQLEWGGGVCQVSTTVYRAAFWGGLPITERHAHPFYISWYDAFSFPDGGSGPGMDATIFTGVQDLKFVNDTANWLLMESVVDEANQTMTVRLYGTKPNRTVSLSGPEIGNVVPPPSEPVYISDSGVPAGSVRQTDQARKGMDISVYRIITENGEQKDPEVFFTRFKAWPNVFVRGTGQ